jgi:hypothetical protein
VGITAADDVMAARVMAAFVDRLGEPGTDLLYDLVSRRGGSRAAARASELLRRDDVRARAGAAVRVAFDLRDAPCSGKAALLDRARTDADERALEVLTGLTAPACAANGCCLGYKSGIDEAVRDVGARLRSR